MADHRTGMTSKVPEVTLWFWIVKILATTLGETGGDSLSMTLKLGYTIATAIVVVFFAVTLVAQVAARRYHPGFYWAVVVATTTVGTTTADLFDRTLGLGYLRSSLILFLAVVAILLFWRKTTGTISADRITTRPNEIFYWITILVSNALGTALGDYLATGVGLGFEGGALVFAGLIAVVAALHLFTKTPTAILFWAAYVLTRPLGATLGDTLDKPHAAGGLAFSRIEASLVILIVMAVGIVFTSRKAAVVEAPAGP